MIIGEELLMARARSSAQCGAPRPARLTIKEADLNLPGDRVLGLRGSSAEASNSPHVASIVGARI